MTLELINPDGLPPPPTYPHVIVATGSRLVFVAGQEPEDADGELVGPGDLGTRARQVFTPVDTIVGVESLAQPGYLIEVEATAVIDG